VNTTTAIAVVGASTGSTATDDTVTVGLDECEFTTPSTSTIETARLTSRLGSRGMKLNARRLDGAAVATPVGTLARVAPPVPRSAVNDGDTAVLWVMVDAPPTGGPRGWDPGATILE